MSLIENSLLGERNKVNIAIKRLQSFEPPEGYFLSFSGGKDSQCIYHLAKMAGVKFEAHFHITSVDPPELIAFIREHYPDVIWDIPKDADGKRMTMWSLIPKCKMPPTRFYRFCCSYLKESAGKGRMNVTGVRWAESRARKENHSVLDIHGKPKTTQKLAETLGVDHRVKKSGEIVLNEDNDAARRMAEQCYRTQKSILNPIIDWTDDDVWEFLNDVAKVPHCCLYDEGWEHIGCIGCPLGGVKQQKEQFERYPKYRALYVKTFDKMLQQEDRKHEDSDTWKSGEDVMKWWLKEEES